MQACAAWMSAPVIEAASSSLLCRVIPTAEMLSQSKGELTGGMCRTSDLWDGGGSEFGDGLLESEW